jgi:hypothetical protein
MEQENLYIFFKRTGVLLIGKWGLLLLANLVKSYRFFIFHIAKGFIGVRRN